MSPLPWISRKKKGPALHSDVFRILQSKPMLPAMPRFEGPVSRFMPAGATPNEACYLFAMVAMTSRFKANPQVNLRDTASQAYRVIELAFALGAYRLALRDEELTEDAVYLEARKVMPELRAQVEQMEAARGPLA